MPTGKRAKQKRHIGFYADEDLREAGKAVLNQKGLTASDYLLSCWLKLLNKTADEIIEELLASDGRTTQGKDRKNKRTKRNE